MIETLANAVVVIILQYINVPNQYIVHLNVYNVSINLKDRNHPSNSPLSQLRFLSPGSCLSSHKHAILGPSLIKPSLALTFLPDSHNFILCWADYAKELFLCTHGHL